MGLSAFFFSIMDASAPFLTFAAVAFAPFLIGALDDWRSMSALMKLAGQIAAATVFVQLFGALETIPAPGLGAIDLGPFAGPVTVFWIVAFMNAYNFMDGVNGIAALTGVFVSVVFAIASALIGEAGLAVICLMLGAALLGFAPVNVRGGRLFLGDGGSMSVGFTIAAVGVMIANAGGPEITALFAPTAYLPFLFDVAFTLAHRIARRRNALAAHREHLYQLLARSGWTHISVATLYLIFTAICCAGAFLMALTPPGAQFIAPLILTLTLLVGAVPLFRRFAAQGYLEKSAPAGDDHFAEDESIAQAAE